MRAVGVRNPRPLSQSGKAMDKPKPKVTAQKRQTALDKWPGITDANGAHFFNVDDVCAGNRRAGGQTFLSKIGHPARRPQGLGIGPQPRVLGYWLFAWFGFDHRTRDAVYWSASRHVPSRSREFLRIPSSLAAAVRWRRSFSPIFSAKNGPHPNRILIPALNAIFSFGEEWGWRGFLSKALAVRPMAGTPLDGSAVGLSPVILLGYNYPSHPKIGIILMTILRHLRRPLWLAGNGKYLAGSDWPWSTQRRRSDSLRGGRWELPYRHRARHYFGLDRLDFASARYPSPGHLKTPPGVRT